MKQEQKEINGLSVNLNQTIKGFNADQKMSFKDNSGEVREMTVKDVLQYSISSFVTKEFNDLKHINRLVNRISDDNSRLILSDPQEKEFLVNAVKNCEVIAVIPKSFVLNCLNAF